MARSSVKDYTSHNVQNLFAIPQNVFASPPHPKKFYHSTQPLKMFVTLPQKRHLTAKTFATHLLFFLPSHPKMFCYLIFSKKFATSSLQKGFSHSLPPQNIFSTIPPNNFVCHYTLKIFLQPPASKF